MQTYTFSSGKVAVPYVQIQEDNVTWYKSHQYRLEPIKTTVHSLSWMDYPYKHATLTHGEILDAKERE
jgi:hypothetical protein